MDRLSRGALLRRALLLAACTTLPATPAVAETSESGFDLSGSVRARGDVIEGQFRPGKAEDDALLMLRTIVKASYDAGPVELVGELVDARVYNQDLDTPISTSDVNALEPLQAYVGLDLGEIVGQGYSGRLKAGRFTMNIGSARLIGRPDDSNFPPAYTGAMLNLATPGESEFQLFWTMPNTRLPKDAAELQDNEVKLDRSTSDVQFYGAHYGRPLFGKVGGEIYAYRLDEQDAEGYPTRNRDLLTYGFRLNREPAAGKLDFDLEYARQNGDIRSGTAATDTAEIDVNAFFFHAQVGRKFSGGWTPRISAHFDIASGDDADSDYSRFDPLYPARRGEFGPTGIYGPISRSNLLSLGLRGEAKPSSKLDLMAMYRALWLEEAGDTFASTGVRDAAGASGKWAGNQVELRVRYKLIPDRLDLEAGGAYLDKGRFLHEAPNPPATGNTRYGYVSLTTKF